MYRIKVCTVIFKHRIILFCLLDTLLMSTTKLLTQRKALVFCRLALGRLREHFRAIPYDEDCRIVSGSMSNIVK